MAGEHHGVLEILINANADPNKQADTGETPLFSACTAGDEDVVNFLLEHGADVNSSVNEEQQSCLHLACTQGNPEIVQVLILTLTLALTLSASLAPSPADLAASSSSHNFNFPTLASTLAWTLTLAPNPSG